MVHSKTGPLHFKTAKGYHNYLAHIHIYNESKGHLHPVFIAGKKHTVCHDCGSMHHSSSQHNMHHPTHHSGPTGSAYRGLGGQKIGSHIGQIATKKQLSDPNKVYSKKSPYAGKNNLYGNILGQKGINVKVPKIRI